MKPKKEDLREMEDENFMLVRDLLRKQRDPSTPLEDRKEIARRLARASDLNKQLLNGRHDA